MLASNYRVLMRDGQPERAGQRVGHHALAESHPFAARTQPLEDVAGRTVKATAAVALPPAVVEAAQKRGQTLDWWETVEALLSEVRELGWTDQDR